MPPGNNRSHGESDTRIRSRFEELAAWADFSHSDQNFQELRDRHRREKERERSVEHDLRDEVDGRPGPSAAPAAGWCSVGHTDTDEG